MPVSESSKSELVRRACEIRKNAYATYSKFPVGASLLTADGTFFDGVNVENASFGLTTCGERSAVFAAVSAGHREFQAVAVATDGAASPCGACRQVLTEFAPELLVLLVDPAKPDDVKEVRLDELLPGRFVFPGKDS